MRDAKTTYMKRTPTSARLWKEGSIDQDRATSRYPYHFPLANYPHRYPEGIKYVLVNGQIVVQKDRHRGVLPGKVLRHCQQQKYAS